VEAECTQLSDPNCLPNALAVFQDVDNDSLERRAVPLISAGTAGNIVLAGGAVAVGAVFSAILKVLLIYNTIKTSSAGPHLHLPPGSIQQVAKYTVYPNVINVETAANDQNRATITTPPQSQTTSHG